MAGGKKLVNVYSDRQPMPELERALNSAGAAGERDYGAYFVQTRLSPGQQAQLREQGFSISEVPEGRLSEE